MTNEKKKSKHLLWGVGNMGEGFISTVSSTYLSIFLTDVALLPLGLVSFIALFTSIFDFCMVPLSGVILVSSKPMKWGRYRSWLLFCPVIAVIFYLICFHVVEGNTILTAICILVGYIGAKAAWNINYASNVSLTAVMAEDQQAKSKLVSQRMIGSNAGRLLGNYITPLLVAWAAVKFSESIGYTITIIITGIVYILTSLIHFRDSRGCENANVSEMEANKEKEEKLSAKEIVLALIANPQLLITLVIDLTSNVASLVLPSLAVYYYKYCAQNIALTSVHMLVIGFSGLAGASIVRLFGTKIKDTRKCLLVMYVIVAVTLFSIRFVSSNPIMFIVFSGIVAIITGMTSPFELNLYIDNTVYYRYTKGKDATGFIMGLSNLPVKFASIIKSTLIPFTLMAVGYVANADPTPEMQAAIINAYTLIPCLFPILGFILLKFVYKLKHEDVEDMKRKIDAGEV